jgi:pimeloyl-ACP methyl ester carboxylesterase
MSPQPAPVPAWFTRAIGVRPQSGSLTWSGTEINFLMWGPGDTPGVILIHGGGAHAHWWDHIAPYLARDQRIVAVDLSGHGDSGHRHAYSLDDWSGEVLAAAKAGGIAGRPVLVGHSMGGMVALRAATSFAGELEAVVVVDTPIGNLTPEDRAAREQAAFGPLRKYPTEQDAIARFRLIPPQEQALPYLVRHIADRSVRRVAGGWSWKFDPKIFDRDTLDPASLAAMRCPTALVRAEHGLLTAEMCAHVRLASGRQAPAVEIPEASHHVMIDQPLTLVTALRALLVKLGCAAP